MYIYIYVAHNLYIIIVYIGVYIIIYSLKKLGRQYPSVKHGNEESLNSTEVPSWENHRSGLKLPSQI